MPTIHISVVLDEADLKTLMAYFETDDPGQAVSQAVKWAAASADEKRRERNKRAHNRKTELLQTAAYTFPDSVQDRIEELLDKKREGDITTDEIRELDRLARAVQQKTVEKARAMAELKLLAEKAS